MVLFSFGDSNLSAAVPAFHIKVGIPSLSWNFGLRFGSVNRVHELPSAQRTVNRAQSARQSIVFSLLFIGFQNSHAPFRQCQIRPGGAG